MGPVVYKATANQLRGLWLSDYDIEVVRVYLTEEEKKRYRELEKKYRNFLKSRGLKFRSPQTFKNLSTWPPETPRRERLSRRGTP